MRDGTRYPDILVVDLLGGLGDLVMVLPVIHALARRNPGAALRVLTHAPGDVLVESDPAVTEVVRAEKGDERAAVAAELDRRRPALVVSTTRHSGIPEEIGSRGVRSVTNLWRNPPPDEQVSHRYLRILAAEGLVDAVEVPPSIHLTPAERARGAAMLADHAGPGRPVVLVPGAGMAVKHWPHWATLARGLADRGTPPLVVTGDPAPGPWAEELARPLPPTGLRGLAALFAAVGDRGGTVVGPDTGPVRVAAAVGARTVGLFGPTAAARYGLGPAAVDLQGLPGCPHRRPTAITEQVCWWEARCPLAADGPACMADLSPDSVLRASLAG
ncbi:glycosyltransferase family 9 protein [Pseudonocardia sp. T1-2H]|uniref:glycosyltransferase family 9 protein n=1 Tax=Pseudonocardia sp. T1-2H TaxID=3128899 RepID=UPI003100C9C2